ncbi:unnamed protein product, partial [Prorocentrum cordatum]
PGPSSLWWRQPPVVVLVPIPGPQNRFRSDPIARCGVDLTLPLPPPAWGAHLPGRGGLGPLARPSLRGGALRARGRPGPVDDVPEQRRDVGAPVRADAWRGGGGAAAGEGALERWSGKSRWTGQPWGVPRSDNDQDHLNEFLATSLAFRGQAEVPGEAPAPGRCDPSRPWLAPFAATLDADAAVGLVPAAGAPLGSFCTLPMAFNFCATAPCLRSFRGLMQVIKALPRRVRGPPCGDARPARRRPRPAPLPRRGRAALAGGAAEAMAAVPPGDEVAHGRRVVGCIRGPSEMLPFRRKRW